MDTQQDLLTDEVIYIKSRRALLPIWIKIFVWIFMMLGALIPVSYIASALGSGFEVAFFGFESTDPFSWQSILIATTLLSNGVIAYLLYSQHTNAIAVALPVAYFNVALCVISMVFSMGEGRLGLRIELIPLIFYIIKLKGIKDDWENGFIKPQLN